VGVRGFTVPWKMLVLASGAALLLVALPAAEAPAIDHRPNREIAERLEWLINSARSGRGLPPVQVDVQVKDGAQVWSDRMAWRGYLYHDPGLEQKMPAEARVWGEVVGRTTDGDAAYTIRNAWFASDAHRRILTEPRFTRIGVGIGKSGDYTYATARFWG
jgi:uncharacterized protein YkwD